MKARQDLQSHYNTISKLHLRQLFKEDPGRGERMTAEAEGIFLDYSKNRITQETLDLLLRLAFECRLQSRIDAMFRGEKINVTENRSVMHVALRAPKGTRIIVDGKDVVPDVHAVLAKMQLRNGVVVRLKVLSRFHNFFTITCIRSFHDLMNDLAPSS